MPLACRRQSARDLRAIADDLFGCDRPFVNSRLKGFAFHVLHHQVVRTHIMDRTDVWMVQLSDCSGLTLETSRELLL